MSDGFSLKRLDLRPFDLGIVLRRLGHSSIYVTATVYAHALASDESAAAEKWEAAIKRAANSKVIEMPRKTKQTRTASVVANASTEQLGEKKATETKLG
jgi:hypothetical protein